MRCVDVVATDIIASSPARCSAVRREQFSSCCGARHVKQAMLLHFLWALGQVVVDRPTTGLVMPMFNAEHRFHEEVSR